jgi:hypothetical protein
VDVTVLVLVLVVVVDVLLVAHRSLSLAIRPHTIPPSGIRRLSRPVPYLGFLRWPSAHARTAIRMTFCHECVQHGTAGERPRYTRGMQPEFDEVARASDPRREQLERRSEARRQKVRRTYPDTGEFLLAMSDEPTAESAFDHGAPWQRWVAELVRAEFPKGVFLFHRRRGPGRHDDIDVVAVLPSGVWVIDIRHYDGARAEVRHAGGGRSGLRYLALDDTDVSAVLDDLDDQAHAVATALTNAGWDKVETRSVLCLVDVEQAWRGHTMVEAAHVTKARPMLKLLAAGPDVLDDTDIASLGLSLDKVLARQHPGR